jgi:hypothetical protein
MSAIQQQLLDTGSHFRPSGSDMQGPAVEVCDACRCPVEFNPGLYCPTPKVHTWTDPGAESGEEIP